MALEFRIFKLKMIKSKSERTAEVSCDRSLVLYFGLRITGRI